MRDTVPATEGQKMTLERIVWERFFTGLLGAAMGAMAWWAVATLKVV